MVGSVLVRTGYRALAMGVRIPTLGRIETFKQQSRTIDEIKRSGVDLVLDVGANKGFYAKHLRMAGYRGRIFSFEPEPATFARLAEAAAGDPNWRVFDFALGDREDELAFNVVRTHEETVLSSLLTMKGTPDSTAIRVQVKRLDEVLPSVLGGEEPRIFLKMDTQGYDLKAFAGASGVPGIVLLQSEISVVPLYDGMPHYTDALRTYEEAGFTLLDLFVVNRTETGGVLEYDALMARAPNA